MKIHLQGMGVVGSGLAWILRACGADFTWDDKESDITAWRSSTGAIYPSPAWRDMAGYMAWEGWHANPPWGRTDLTEAADYWYCTQKPPHRYRSRARADVREVGPLKLHEKPSYHLHVQRFVEHTRASFADQRRDACPEGSQLVIAHGFNDRRKRYVWGWSEAVTLDVSALGPSERRPSIYLRPGLSTLAYAYPMPGEPFWYAGSSLYVMTAGPKKRNPDPDYERWIETFTRLTGGVVPIVSSENRLLQGWRPSTGPVEGEDDAAMWERGPQGELVVMPCWHSGVRWLPVICKEFLKEVGL